MFTFKPKKVFEKLNKMDRKQAYTIGAIAVVTIVALLMLVSVVTNTNDDSFEGMAARGYDLANMPFATDAAEQYLLAAKYPDMQENGSTLLYSAAQKEARQEEDAQATSEEDSSADETVSDHDDNTSAARSDNGGSPGGGRSGGRGGRGKTEVGQLGTATVAHSGGSVLNATGPTGDFRQFKGKEDRGSGAPVQLNTGNARQALAQFRQGSRAGATFKNNRMTAQKQAVMGANVTGSEAVTKDGVDLSKAGGLELDTSAPPSSHDLDNLDKKVAEAAKKAEDKKKEEKLEWWEQMLIDLAKSAAQSLVNAVMDGVGDTVKGVFNGNSASRAARNEYGASMAGKAWNADGKCSGNCLTQQQTQELMKNNVTQDTWENASVKQQKKMGRKTASAWAEAAEAKEVTIGKANGSSSARRTEQQNTGDPCKNVNCGDDYEATVVGNTCTCKKKNK